MTWKVLFDKAFACEFKEFDKEVKIELRALVLLLEDRGPELGRPRADTLNGSAYANMKSFGLMPLTEFGGRRLHSIRREKQLSSSPEISLVPTKRSFTRN